MSGRPGGTLERLRWPDPLHLKRGCLGLPIPSARLPETAVYGSRQRAVRAGFVDSSSSIPFSRQRCTHLGDFARFDVRDLRTSPESPAVTVLCADVRIVTSNAGSQSEGRSSPEPRIRSTAPLWRFCMSRCRRDRPSDTRDTRQIDRVRGVSGPIRDRRYRRPTAGSARRVRNLPQLAALERDIGRYHRIGSFRVGIAVLPDLTCERLVYGKQRFIGPVRFRPFCALVPLSDAYGLAHSGSVARRYRVGSVVHPRFGVSACTRALRHRSADIGQTYRGEWGSINTPMTRFDARERLTRACTPGRGSSTARHDRSVSPKPGDRDVPICLAKPTSVSGGTTSGLLPSCRSPVRVVGGT